MTNDFKEKYKDSRWQRRRAEISLRDDYACQICRADDHRPIQVHHKYYKWGADPWDYPDDALVTLCDDCHGEEHGIVKEPEYPEYEPIAVTGLNGMEMARQQIIRGLNSGDKAMIDVINDNVHPEDMPDAFEPGDLSDEPLSLASVQGACLYLINKRREAHVTELMDAISKGDSTEETMHEFIRAHAEWKGSSSTKLKVMS